MKLSRKAVVGMVAALTIAVFTAGCGEVKIGYINQDRINDECPQIKAATEEWQNKINELQSTAIQELNAMVEAGATEEELTQKQQEYQMKAATMNQQFQAQTRAKVDVAIDEAAKAKELDTVMRSSTEQKTVVSGGVDITDDVIQRLQ